MMKKFVAGKGAAGLILAGLMVSSGAMAAAGDVVTGGSGTVKINVPLVTSTCTVTVPTEVNFDPINKNDVSRLSALSIASKNFDITLNHCSGNTLNMTVHAPLFQDGAIFYGKMDGVDDIMYEIHMLNPGPGITGGARGYTDGRMLYDFTGNKPFTIIPDSDSYTFTSEVDLVSNGLRTKPVDLPDTLNGSFTYNVTYM